MRATLVTFIRELWSRTAGLDGPGHRALPAGEFLHPIALIALAVLAVNDHILKGSSWIDGAVTGKISDVAGLAFFPLLMTAVFDTALFAAARLGARTDFSLRRWKLIVATAATAAMFTALKLASSFADAAERAAASIGWSIEIVADPTDLIALPALLVAAAIGLAELRRLPLGRIEVIEKSGARDPESIRALLADIDSDHRDELAQALAMHLNEQDSRPLIDALRHLRRVTREASGTDID